MKGIALIILDGWGYAPDWGGNAVTESRTPNFDKLWREFPHTTIQASGEYVGLPGHEMGNSEVGHLNLGAGRVVYQDIKRINNAIEDSSFFTNKVLLRAMDQAKKQGNKLHMLGLVSDGGVHSHIDHLYALLEMAKKEKVKSVFIHAITDGRDTEPTSGINQLTHLANKIKELGVGRIASITGRYFSMDRDSRFDRTNKAYEAMVLGKGEKADNPLHAISLAYKNGESDEFIKPIVVDKNGIIEDGDSVIFFNFRSDRARQITTFIIDEHFKKFKRKKILRDIYLVSMIPYYEYDLDMNVHPAFSPKMIKNPLAQVISEKGMPQFHIAETEKYAHVTYFFNGAREKPFAGEDRILVPSPKVPTYELKPEMSSDHVTKEVIKAIKKDKYKFLLVNYANPDMVGHTGNFEATVKAVETVDKCLGAVIETIKNNDYSAIITADHGNAETMINVETGGPHTEHTNNPVPLIFFNHEKLKLLADSALCNVAPMVIELLNLDKPIEMNVDSLILQNPEDEKKDGIIEYHL